jgi:hypothetical protein
MAANEQQHVAEASASAASSDLLGVPVEQLPMIMPVQKKLLRML